MNKPKTKKHKKPVSEAQLAANRANAQKSTGPITQFGVANARFNAVRHNLTGRSLLLAPDECDLYATLCAALHNEFKPQGVREELLVQNIADHQWRLSRIPSLEAGIYSLGRLKRDPEPDPNNGPDNIDACTLITYDRDFRNLYIQESRLKRYLKNDMAELATLQQTRLAEEKEEFELAAAMAAEAAKQGNTFHPEQFGFVFSTADLQAFTHAKGNLKLAKKLIERRRAHPATAPETLPAAA